MSQTTIVKIDRLTLPLSIGVLPREKKSQQNVVISIDMTVEIPDRPSEEDQNYVSYAPIVEHLEKLSGSKRHIDLVEQLADEIFSFLFQDARIGRVKIEVMKPDIFPQAAGVGVLVEKVNPSRR